MKPHWRRLLKIHSRHRIKERHWLLTDPHICELCMVKFSPNLQFSPLQRQLCLDIETKRDVIKYATPLSFFFREKCVRLWWNFLGTPRSLDWWDLLSYCIRLLAFFIDYWMIAKFIHLFIFYSGTLFFYTKMCWHKMLLLYFFLFSQCAFIPYRITTLTHIGLLQCND